MRRTSRIVYILAGIGIVVAFLSPLVWQLVFGMPGNADFFLHRNKYNGVVDSAKSLGVMPGESTQSSIAGLNTWVSRAQDGSYTVTILTKDSGEGQAYGYKYSESGLSDSAVQNPPTETSLPGDGLRFVNGQLNDHWWLVRN